MLKLDCEVDREELDRSIDGMSGVVEYLSELLRILYNIVSGKLFADILREKLGLGD